MSRVFCIRQLFPIIEMQAASIISRIPYDSSGFGRIQGRCKICHFLFNLNPAVDIMNTGNFEQQDTSDINTVASVAIDFPSLYSAGQHDYERNDVRNVFIQLLDTYQPEDGITAYECVLKKAQGFLTNCDFHKKQLLLSMIPIPTNASSHAIKDIFRVTTGFTKLNLSEKYTLQSIFDIKNMDRTTDKSISSSKQDFSYNKNVSNLKLSLCEGFPFRGFPENEISTIHNNADPSNQLNNNPKNWLNKNNKCQASFYRQYLLDKKYCDRTKIDTTESLNISYSPRQADTCSLKAYNNEAITDFCHEKIPRQSTNNVKLEKYEDTNVFDKDKQSGISQIIIDVRQNAIFKQTIKDNTYQMDVCLDGDQNFVVDADDLLAITRDRLKASLNNFLKRAQEGAFLELSAFPCTKSYSQMDSLKALCFASKDRKSETPRKVLEKDFVSSIPNGGNLLSKRQSADMNLEDNQRALDKRVKQKTFSYVTGLQVKTDSQELGKAIELQNGNGFEPITIERKQVGTEKFICKMAGSRPNDANPEKDFQVHSMSELAAYKKQYYDTLLNIQRAKVAVTNSLACSTDHLTAYNDPYYANYMCQQKHLFHQQRHFAVRPQFSTCPTALAGLSSTRNNQYNWTRPDCKYLLLKQLRLQRQASPLYTRNQDGWIHSYSGPVYPYPFMLNGNGQMKRCTRRKNLESLVGKLKGSERSSVNN